MPRQQDARTYRQLCRSTRKINQRNGVAKHIPHPHHCRRRPDIELEGFDADVMPLARAHHEAMQTKGHGFGVVIRCQMIDAVLHNSPRIQRQPFAGQILAHQRFEMLSVRGGAAFFGSFA